MIAGENEIVDFIPQRYPFVMVSNLISSDETSTTCSYLVQEENIFVRNGVLQAPALIENMAQTAAAGVGYQFSIKKEVVPIGFIGAIKSLEISSLPKTGQLLFTKVNILQEIFGVTLIGAEIYVDHQKIASCEMKIVLQKA